MRSTDTNATRFLLKRNLFIGIAVFVTVFFLFPFWGLSHIADSKANILLYTPVEDQARSFSVLVSTDVMNRPLNLEGMTALFGALGFFTALMLMRHLFSRRQSLLHAALPDRREKDYLRRCIAYGVLCLAPIVMNIVLYLLVVACNGLLGYVNWAELMPKFLLLLLINLYGFSLGMLSCVLTGTQWAAVLAGMVLTVSAEGMAYLWHNIASRYLHTMVDTGLRELMRTSFPTFSLYKGFYRPAEFSALPGIAAIVLALAASFLLYRTRKTEAASHTLAFGWLHTVLGFVIPLLGGSVLGMIVYLSLRTEASLVCGMFLGAMATYWACRMLFAQRFCGILHQWYLPAAAGAVLIVGIVLLHTDALSYDHFLPQRDELTSISYRPTSYTTEEKITLTSDEALDAAYEWCTLMRDEADGYSNGLENASEAHTSSSVIVTYDFAGRKVYRRYPNGSARNAAQDALGRMMESDDYRQSLIGELHLDDGIVHSISCSTHTNILANEELYERFGVFPNLMHLSGEEDSAQIQQWVAALRADLSNRTLAIRQEDPLLALHMSTEIPETGKRLYYFVDIHPGDKQILKAIFGDKADEIVAYATGGYAASEDVVLLKVRYAMSRGDLSRASITEQEAVESITLPASPEEAAAWLHAAQSTSAKHYYYMPNHEDACYTRLYVYRLSEVEKYRSMYGYTIPASKTDLFTDPLIPHSLKLDMKAE